MDHWGDPWADNANDKSPRKGAATSPLPPAFTFTSGPLNGFVDEAGWGNNDDEGFEEWATLPKIGAKEVKLAGAEPLPPGNKALGSANWDSVSYGEREDLDDEWPRTVSSTPQDPENVDSEPSDSATVTQFDDAVEAYTVRELTFRPQPDIELSAQPSTSPSEASRNELPIESPRTSIEDERIASGTTKDTTPQDEALVSIVQSDTILADVNVEAHVEDKDTEKALQSTENIDEHGPDPSDVKTPLPNSSVNSSASDIEETSEPISEDADRAYANQSQARVTAFTFDPTLLALIFPQSEMGGEQTEPPDGPIYSTSARKAWYRLTRKQTMREFNHGDNDGNYVRVTWTNSHIRTEVNKVVSRWAREDRISGTGPGAKASFYWDTPAPVESKTPFGHLRTQSSVPTTKIAAPARQSLPPLAANKAAAFDWSSSASADTWKLDSPAQRSTSTPLTLENLTVAKLRRQEGRAVSVDLTSSRPEQTPQKPAAIVSHIAVASPILPPVSQSSAEASIHWANSSLDTISIPAAEAEDSFGDDDDWGEMVQTPTLPTLDQTNLHPQPSEVDNAPVPPLPEPSQQATVLAQTEPAEPAFSSPIVRLQSTISPTSALFKHNSFVPLHTEQGPVGPGILKPADGVSHSISAKKLESNVPTSPSAEMVGTSAKTTDDDMVDNGDESFSYIASVPVSASPIVEESRPALMMDRDPISNAQPAAPIQATADPWTNADFSCFESALPVTISQPHLQTHNSSDPLSFFNTTIPTPMSTANPFSYSPPHDRGPPPPQPLANATNSVQRRKAEEDHIISSILGGLPDLSFMLR